MSTDIIPFLFQPADTPLPVRVVIRAGEPWFVAADVCRILVSDPNALPSQGTNAGAGGADGAAQ